MSDHKKLPPPIRYFPTDSSLDLAKQVAEQLGLSYNETQTTALAGNLYEVMFDDLIHVLELHDHNISLHAGGYHIAKAFAVRDVDQHDHIILDMVFDYLIDCMALFMAVVSFKILTDSQRYRLITDLNEIFGLFRNPQQFKAKRELMLEYYNQHPECIDSGFCIARAMTVFILCHEIAHCTLSHLGHASSKEQELEADCQAAHYFLHVVEKGRIDNQTHIHVDSKIAAAPLLLCHLLGLYEAWNSLHHNDPKAQTTHPLAMERLEAIEAIILPKLEDKAKEIYEGMRAGIADIKRWMQEMLQSA